MTQAATLKTSPLGYRGTLISAESYVTEPPELWQQALPAQWRQQGPRVSAGPQGDQFEIAGTAPRSLGLHGPLAQLRRIDVDVDHGYENYRYDAASSDRDGAARLAWQRAAGIAAEVVYPTLGLLLSTSPDAQLQQLCCRIYNDWLAELCAADPTRLRGMALLPAKADMTDIVAEDDRAGILTRDVTGVETLLWGSDYPHTEGVWPFLRRQIAHDFAGIPAADTRRIVHDNAVAIFGFPAG